ncbi:MAG: hypothetical protein PSV46_16975 [Reyranella sp.]|nr:hypothetical protein [Reyranella sp.]
MDLLHNYPAAAAAPRQRLVEIDDAIASIRAQIAASDLQRQASKKPIDPRWFHRAKTALRHLQRERAGLVLQPVPRRESLKDCLIAVLRERHDEATWWGLLGEARRRAGGEGL